MTVLNTHVATLNNVEVKNGELQQARLLKLPSRDEMLKSRVIHRLGFLLFLYLTSTFTAFKR